MSQPTGLTFLQAMNPFSHDHIARDAFGLFLGIRAFYFAGSKKYVAPLNLSKALTAGAIAFGGLEVYKNMSAAEGLKEKAIELDKKQKHADAKMRNIAALTYLVVIGLGVYVLSKPELASKVRIPKRFHVPLGKEILYAAGTGLVGALALSFLGRVPLPVTTLKENDQELIKMKKDEINNVVVQLNQNKTELAGLNQLFAILGNENRTEPVTAVPGLVIRSFSLLGQESIDFYINKINAKELTAPEAIVGAILNGNAKEKLAEAKAFEISEEFLKRLSKETAEELLTKYQNNNELFTGPQVLALIQVMKVLKQEFVNGVIQKIPAKEMQSITAEEFGVIKQLLAEDKNPLELLEDQWDKLVLNESINKNAIWIINQAMAVKLKNCTDRHINYLIKLVDADQIKHLSEGVAIVVAKEPQSFELTAQQVVALLSHKSITHETPVDISEYNKVFNQEALKNLSKEEADALAKAYGTEEGNQKLVLTKEQHEALNQNRNLTENTLREWREIEGK